MVPRRPLSTRLDAFLQSLIATDLTRSTVVGAEWETPSLGSESLVNLVGDLAKVAERRLAYTRTLPPPWGSLLRVSP